MSNEPISREAKLLIQLGEMGNELHHWKSECLEQARLLAMSADREEKMRAALRGLIFFAEEDQHLAAPAYRKAFLRAQEALK